jgi:hypothetical protein
MLTVRSRNSVRKSSSIRNNKQQTNIRTKKSIVKKSRYRSRSVSKSGGKIRQPKSSARIVNFYCMKCRKHSKEPVDRYERSKKSGGALSAKGRCSKCDTKMSMFVKSEQA